MCKPSIRQVLNSLVSEYGIRNWQPDGDPLSTLVETILSQNTSDINSHRAFATLLASFPRWEDVAVADAGKIAASIRAGGLEGIKAKRIKQTLQEIRQKRGRLELDFLNGLPIGEARDWLRRLPGVGPKTANCVLLFSLGKPALPVDTHIFRVAKRLGLIDSRATVEQAHEILERLVPSKSVYQFHVLMIEHGRKVCRAQRPRCPGCAMRGFCPSYGKFPQPISGQ